MKSLFSVKMLLITLAFALMGVGSVSAQDKADLKRYEDKLKRQLRSFQNSASSRRLCRQGRLTQKGVSIESEDAK